MTLDSTAGRVTADTLEYLPNDSLVASPHYNADLAPVTVGNRKWGTKDIAALWISMSACVTTYMLASDMIDHGMNWWQAILTIFLGNLVVLIPMILNGHAGAKYGIPFPVYCRPSFGILGANVPALLRALVACGWFGIQTWIGGAAIHSMGAVLFPSWLNAGVLPIGITVPQLACFLIFWLINMAVIYAGVESIRLLLNFKAPLLIALGLALLGWAYYKANGFGSMLSQPSAFAAGQPKAGQFWSFFIPALTANVGYWATLSLNIPDFTRYARSQKDQIVGQAIGLPPTMALYSFIGVAVTSATIVIYGKAIWDPVVLLSKFTNPIVLILAMFALCLATLATNIAANVVSPANDFAHLAPRLISFRVGGLITGIIGMLMMPWKLLADPSGYIFTWLIGYSSLLGAIGGILIGDYFIVRKTSLDLVSLYETGGQYWYRGGINWTAIVALFVGIAPCVPGFIKTVHPATGWVPPAMVTLYSYAWFVSFGIALVTYVLMTLSLRSKSNG